MPQNNSEEKIPIEKLKEIFDFLEWPDLTLEDGKLLIGTVEKEVLAEFKEKHLFINLFWRDRDGKYNKNSGVKTLVIDEKLELQSYLYISRGKYKISYFSEIKSILGMDSEAEVLHISKKNKKISYDSNSKYFFVPLKKYEDIMFDARLIYKTVKSYADSVRRYKINQAIEKFFNKEIQKTTHIEKGEFYFLVHRLNLETKKKKEDVVKFLDENDINSLQNLVRLMVRKEVFDKNFLKELDAYFIRENLQNIIKLGHKLLKLNSNNLKTKSAKSIVKELSSDNRNNIKQFETLWQVYFEKYLLYLIFTYKEIFPKVKLKLTHEKKNPDFIGVNHYNGIDVIEIKTHLTPALVWDKSHKNFAFSSELSKAIIQTMNYMDALKSHGFKNQIEREKIIETSHEENLYRPRGIIIISSKDRLVKNCKKYDTSKIERDFTKLRNSLHNIEILTFDEVIDIAQNYSEKIVRNKKSEAV